MKTKNIIIIILISLLAVYLIIGFIQVAISNSKCKAECNNQGALTYNWIASGGLSIKNDVCSCIFRDNIKSFKVGDIK